MKYDVAIVGGGIIGLATAFQLSQRQPRLKILLLEKESRLAAHQSSHNSGVLHAGLYYHPGSEKARLCVAGLQQMIAFCREHGIAHEVCGKIVVATSEDELPRLETLWQRGLANGLQGLRKLDARQIKEIEPHAAGIAAVHVPQEGIVDYPAVCQKLAELIRRNGGEIKLNARVLKIRDDSGGKLLETVAGTFHARLVVGCAGLHSDHVVKISGQKPAARIVPFRGEYYLLKKERRHLVRHLIYPVPDPKFPFLGVHFTRLISGEVEAGPNAVLAFAREGYRWTQFNLRDFAGAMTFPGLWKFLFRYPGVSAYEIWRSLSKAEFTRSLQKLVPEIRTEDLEPGSAGVRAQAMDAAGNLLNDFCFVEVPGMVHVLNAPSPGATASLTIGAKIAEKILTRLEPFAKMAG